jgi:hypothetical protein
MPSQAAAINVVSIVATCEVSEVWHFPEDSLSTRPALALLIASVMKLGVTGLRAGSRQLTVADDEPTHRY